MRQLLAAAELPEAQVRLGRPAPPLSLAAGQDSGRPEAGDAAGAGQLIDIGGNPLQDRRNPGQVGHDVRPVGVIALGAQVGDDRDTCETGHGLILAAA